MSVIVHGVNMPKKGCEDCFLSGWCYKNMNPADRLATYIRETLECPIEEMKEKAKPKIDANIYDKETTIHGCAVQILENTVTGKTSVGWWREKNE